MKILRYLIVGIWITLPIVWDPRLSDYYLIIRFVWAGLLGLLIMADLLIKKSDSGNLSMRKSWLDVCMISILLIHWISMLWATNPAEALFNNVRWTLLLAFFWIIKIWIKREKAFFKIFKYVTSIQAGLYFLIVAGGILLVTTKYGFTNQDLYRLQFPAGHKSLISEYILLLLPVLYCMKGRLKIKWLLISMGGLLIICLQSRAAYLGLAGLLGLGLILEFSPFKTGNRKIILFIVFMLVSLIIIPILAPKPSILSRLDVTQYVRSQTAGQRLTVWGKSMRMIKDTPVMGVGSGNWKIHLPQYGIEEDWIIPHQDRELVNTRAHNDFLEVWSESGIIGFIGYLGLFLFGIRYAWSLPDKSNRNMGLMMIFAFLAISLFDFPKERIEHMLILISTLAIIDTERKGGANLHFSKSWLWSSLIMLMAGMLYCGARYRGEIMLKDGLIARAVGDNDQVIENLAQINKSYYSLDYAAIPIRWYEGIAYFQSNQSDPAHQKFLRASRDHPFHYHTLHNLGTTYFLRNQADSAVYYYEKTLEIFPAFEEAKFNLSIAYTGLADFASAKAILQSVKDTSRRTEFLQIIEQKILEQQ